jgi:hypothetical protein
MMKKVIVIVVWVICGYVNYGMTLGYFTHKFPYVSNVSTAITMTVLGPFGTPVVLISSAPTYHWLTKPKSAEERWEIFHKEVPHLDRDYFEENLN